MSLSSTSFSSESMVAKVKLAMHMAAFGHGHATVLTRKGKALMTVRHRKGEGFAFYRGNRNITSIVMAGARRHHGSN